MRKILLATVLALMSLVATVHTTPAYAGGTCNTQTC
jgi:hypothetical protein